MSTTVRKSKVILAAAIAAAGLTAAAPSFAAEDDLTIRFKSYMLDSNAAASDLYASIESKVENYCESTGVRSLANRRLEAACVDTMLDRTIASIGSYRLDAIHKGRNSENVAP